MQAILFTMLIKKANLPLKLYRLIYIADDLLMVLNRLA
jgi:hypothetical protein